MNVNSWSFVIVAAGSGSRMGGELKQFRQLGAVPLWKWSAYVADKLWVDGRIAELVIVVPLQKVNSIIDLASDLKVPVRVVAGGEFRSESVVKGLEICCGSHVLIHDAARPFLTEDLCLKLMCKADKFGSAVPLLVSSDSLKKIENEKLLSVDRNEYFRTQTPQAFEKNPLLDAIRIFGMNGTDEAVAWEATGNVLYAVEGEDANFKLTTPFDWTIADSIVRALNERRTGHGYDIHKLVPGRKLILAGVEIDDSNLGLLGHSDADIVAHAVMDAILGAAGEPDIGTIFPAEDQRWKDAASTKMLEYIVRMVRTKGWKIDWVDVTLVAQTPRLGHMIPRFILNLTPYLSELDSKPNLNMKVKSGEGCGSVGRSECMVCYSVATLSRTTENWH